MSKERESYERGVADGRVLERERVIRMVMGVYECGVCGSVPDCSIRIIHKIENAGGEE